MLVDVRGPRREQVRPRAARIAVSRERRTDLITALSHTTIWVLDQDEALDFYTQKLGFDVKADATMDDFRWLTVSAPERPDHELVLLVPGPPMMDEESAEQVKALVAKGALGPCAFETDDCRATWSSAHAASSSYRNRPSVSMAVEATLRDNSGNWFSMIERAEGRVGP